MSHPVATLVQDAAAGRFPPADGGWHRVPPWRDGVEAVLSFTGHAVLAVADDVPDALPADVRAHLDGYGGATHPSVLLALAGADGWIDCLDALLVRSGGDADGRTDQPPIEPLVDRPDLAGHPRVGFARAVRDDTRVLGPRNGGDGSVATVGRGIGGLWELSVELAPQARGQGRGAALIRSALAATPPEQTVVAAVAPGNAASLRAFLSAGFSVVGSVQLLRPQRSSRQPHSPRRHRPAQRRGDS